jgi:DNA polymerase (family 10)
MIVDCQYKPLQRIVFIIQQASIIHDKPRLLDRSKPAGGLEMINPEIAKIFYYMADILEMKNVAWKPIAYRKAARVIESWQVDLATVYKRGGLKALEDIPGIGESMAAKIEEFIKTGKVNEFEKLKKQMPVNVEELMEVEGLGPKRVMLLYKKLGIRTRKELEAAAKAGKISKIPSLGKKSEENILKAISFAKTSGKRKLLGHALPIVNEILEQLRKQPYIKRAEIAGSAARKKETVGDLDFLIITTRPKEAMDFFTSLPAVNRIIAKGPTKATVIYNDIEADARVLKPEEFGSAMQYFIGSVDHNVALRRIAISKGYKLSEYGLFKGKKQIAGKDEKDVYTLLGLQWMPPELRENRGEVEAAQKGKLPKLVELRDINCDLQMHTKYSDGNNTVAEMASACQKLGYSFCAITDHVGQLAVAGAMSRKEVLKQRKEIEKLNDKLKGFTILHGAEVDIKLNGELAAPTDLLKNYDLVLASIHQGLGRSKEQQTERMVKAMSNKYVNVIAHPTGRLINERPGYQLDFEKVFKAARENNVAVEANGYPNRMDLSDVNAKAAKDAGVMLSLGTDSHSVNQLQFMELGVSIARRAWCEKKDVLNTLPLSAFKKRISR